MDKFLRSATASFFTLVVATPIAILFMAHGSGFVFELFLGISVWLTAILVGVFVWNRDEKRGFGNNVFRRGPVTVDVITLEIKQMQLRIGHFFLLTAVVAIALAMRVAAISTGSVFVTLMTAIAISPFTTLIMQFLGSNTKASIGAGVLSSALVWGIHFADFQMQTPSTEYAWHYNAGGIFLFVVPIYLASSLFASWLTTSLWTRNKGVKDRFSS